MNENYLGIIFALSASILWSITVTLIKPISQNVSPFLINPIKNSIGLMLFFISFIIFDISLWYDGLHNYEYIIILFSGALGMFLGDTIFIYALNKIGANRVAIVDAFSPIIIFSYSLLLLPNQNLSILQIFGFIITILGLLILAYENDYEDIDYKVKRFGILLVLCAMMCTGFGVVYLKTVLNRINELNYDIQLNLWVTAFRLIPGVILSWILFLFQKNKVQLIKPIKNKSNFIPLLIASFIGPFIALGCWILGYAFIDKPSVASIIGQTAVIFIVLLSWIFLKESLTKFRILSMICVFIGVVLTTINL
ncbi:DMT family transporter [bacterium]|nr:MAG: DMT family transporter [bacterium]|tara:strand:- start:4373 stop:5299 length:927 start_codon:yes stop_codon:yes gene_type:complete